MRYLLYLLLGLWQEVQQAGGYEDPAREAGGEADQGGAGLLAAAAQQPVGQQPAQQRGGRHQEEGQHLGSLWSTIVMA